MKTVKETYVAPQMEEIEIETSGCIMNASDMAAPDVSGDGTGNPDKRDFWGN